MDIIIRTATPEDAFKISLLIKNSMGFDNPAQIIRENLERILPMKTDIILVAECNDEIVGIAHAEDYNTLYDPPIKELMSLAVKTEYQGQKVGTRLMQEIEKWALDTGRKGVRVLSADNWKNGHKLYQSIGYEYIKTQLKFQKFF